MVRPVLSRLLLARSFSPHTKKQREHPLLFSPYHVSFYRKYANSNVSTKKITASTTVARVKKASTPRAFCFPISCSAPPDIAPDSPALRPDCSKTTVINAIDVIINNTYNRVSKNYTSTSVSHMINLSHHYKNRNSVFYIHTAHLRNKVRCKSLPLIIC